MCCAAIRDTLRGTFDRLVRLALNLQTSPVGKERRREGGKKWPVVQSNPAAEDRLHEPQTVDLNVSLRSVVGEMLARELLRELSRVS